MAVKLGKISCDYWLPTFRHSAYAQSTSAKWKRSLRNLPLRLVAAIGSFVFATLAKFCNSKQTTSCKQVHSLFPIQNLKYRRCNELCVEDGEHTFTFGIHQEFIRVCRTRLYSKHKLLIESSRSSFTDKETAKFIKHSYFVGMLLQQNLNLQQNWSPDNSNTSVPIDNNVRILRFERFCICWTVEYRWNKLVINASTGCCSWLITDLLLSTPPNIGRHSSEIGLEICHSDWLSTYIGTIEFSRS